MRKLSGKTKIGVYWLSQAINVVFASTAFSYVSQIEKTKKEISELKESYNEKLTTEENLKEEISKLQDSEYMARYAREKYLYSKKGEIIIKIED